MGLYGSPELGPFNTKESPPNKLEGYKPQTNVWFWTVIIIMNIVMLAIVGITLENIITLLALDSIILCGISVVSLTANLIKHQKTGNDIKFIGISILIFFTSAVILGTLN